MTSRLEIENISPGLGAEVHGLDPKVPLDDDNRRLLRSAFDDLGVLVFRGLEIDRPYQAGLALLVHGETDLSDEHVQAAAAKQSTFYISNKLDGAAAPFGRLMFHSDMVWSDSPFTVLSLYGEAVEPPVAPTAFASTAQAWATLPDALRARVEGLTAVQVTGPEGFGHRRRGMEDGDLVQPQRDRILNTTTPVGNRHPRTGRTLLFVSQGMTKEIVGLSPDDSEALLEDLFEHMYAPANCIQHEWQAGDLVMWDNLSVQHARPHVTTEGPVRTLRKIGWPIPVGAKETKVLAYEKVD
jgi:alpha-ketoglutarate-dependent taurine dioxygenase